MAESSKLGLGRSFFAEFTTLTFDCTGFFPNSPDLSVLYYFLPDSNFMA